MTKIFDLFSKAKREAARRRRREEAARQQEMSQLLVRSPYISLFALNVDMQRHGRTVRAIRRMNQIIENFVDTHPHSRSSIPSFYLTCTEKGWMLNDRPVPLSGYHSIPVDIVVPSIIKIIRAHIEKARLPVLHSPALVAA